MTLAADLARIHAMSQVADIPSLTPTPQFGVSAIRAAYPAFAQFHETTKALGRAVGNAGMISFRELAEVRRRIDQICGPQRTR